jgi:hypothetical protein
MMVTVERAERFQQLDREHATSQSSGQDTLIDFDPLGHPG